MDDLAAFNVFPTDEALAVSEVEAEDHAEGADAQMAKAVEAVLELSDVASFAG
jgi:hypothetical protein